MKKTIFICLFAASLIACSDDDGGSPSNVLDFGRIDMGDMSADTGTNNMNGDMASMDMGPDFPPSEPYLGIQPAAPTMSVGETQQLTITFVDPMNNFMTEVTGEATFVSENPDIVTVEDGLLTAVAVGSSVISIRARELVGMTRVRVAPGWARVAAGAAHTCALADDFSVHCWGDNSMGQLGSDMPAQSSQPVRVPNLTARVIASGDNHVCAVLFDETVQCWGDNSSGQTAGGTVSLPSAVQDIVAGANHTCAIAYQDPVDPSFGGSVYCWGATNADQTPGTPGRVGAENAYESISAGSNHTCGTNTNGEVECWGDNSANQLGAFQGGSSAAPVSIVDNFPGRVIAGGDRGCVSNGANGIRCWGSATTGLGDGSTTTSETPVAIDFGAPIRFSTLALGKDHACVSLQSGSQCWGANVGGELGNAEDDASSTPDDVDGDPTFGAMSAGDAHTCALTLQQGLFCFGANNLGQLGDGTTARRRVPGQVLPPAAP